jgi:hypothetical protein
MLCSPLAERSLRRSILSTSALRLLVFIKVGVRDLLHTESTCGGIALSIALLIFSLW